MELRSNFPVGSPRWATRRTQWKALGLTDEDLTKPKIAVVNSSSKLAPCFSHLDAIADQVCESVREAGGVAFEIRTVAPTDFIMAPGQRAATCSPAGTCWPTTSKRRSRAPCWTA